MKKVSLITPNYNHAKFLPEYFESILSLSHRPDEIIIIDDKSTDNSVEIIKSYQNTIPEIVLLKNEANRGVHYSFNYGIDQAKYDLVAMSAADDIFFPDFFAKCLSLFRQHPDLALVFADMVRFQNIKPYQFERLKFHPSNSPQIFTPDDFVKIHKRNPTFCICSCTVYKKSILLNYGKYDVNLKSICDYFLNAKIAFQHPVGYIPEPLTGFRLVNQSYGRSFRFQLKNRLHLLDYMMNQLWMHENKSFRKKMIDSGYLAWNGYFFLLYVILHPYYWPYFLLFAYQIVRHKFEMKKLNLS